MRQSNTLSWYIVHPSSQGLPGQILIVWMPTFHYPDSETMALYYSSNRFIYIIMRFS